MRVLPRPGSRWPPCYLVLFSFGRAWLPSLTKVIPRAEQSMIRLATAALGKDDASRVLLDRLESLAALPDVARVVLIFRHGEKETARCDAADLPDEAFWRAAREAALTATGEQQAADFGERLRRAKGLRCVELLSSEVPRCMATAEAVARGAACGLTIRPVAAWMNATHRPGEEKAAADEMKAVGWQDILQRLSCGKQVDGYLPLHQAVERLRGTCGFSSAKKNGQPLDLVLVCTHDVLLYALASFFQSNPKAPDFLEAALWWQDGREHFFYDGQEVTSALP
ncbi:unnamed protein product [Effrenium voratum]|uniref:Histidine phosphatase family protein n=1 Tax=Effrenium voratum TaxID=2562239 RepID=A0AA36IJP0_9DINO|nr:unnamed protein product [Effrenium voratum]